MLERSIAGTIVATTVALLFGLSAPPAAAQDNTLHFFVSNGMKGSVGALQGQCEKELGRRLAIQFGSTASLKQRIEAGEAFDATIITIEAIDDLIKKALLTSATRMAIRRSELGVGIRAGASKPDIRSARHSGKRSGRHHRSRIRRMVRVGDTLSKCSRGWPSPVT